MTRITLAPLTAALRSAGGPVRAAGDKRHLKSELRHLGVDAAGLTAIARGWLRDHPDLSREQLGAMARASFRHPHAPRGDSAPRSSRGTSVRSRGSGRSDAARSTLTETPLKAAVPESGSTR